MAEIVRQRKNAKRARVVEMKVEDTARRTLDTLMADLHSARRDFMDIGARVESSIGLVERMIGRIDEARAAAANAASAAPAEEMGSPAPAPLKKKARKETDKKH